MKYLGLASVVVLALCLGMFIPQAGANSQQAEALALKKQEARALKLQQAEALALKKQEVRALKLQQAEPLAIRKQEAHVLQLQQEQALAPQLLKEEALTDLRHQGVFAVQLQQELQLQQEEALAPKKQEAFALSSGNSVGANSNNSVPVPGTVLLFGVVFVGLVWWHERQRRA